MKFKNPINSQKDQITTANRSPIYLCDINVTGHHEELNCVSDIFTVNRLPIYLCDLNVRGGHEGLSTSPCQPIALCKL